jgi:uncharacterized protein (TIGR03086 family)
MTSDPLADLDRAFEVVGRLIAEIPPEQWSAPTPCRQWNVRDVVDHLIMTNRTLTAQIGGKPLPETADRPQDDPVEYHRTSSAALASVFAAPGVLEQVIVSPMGEITGEVRLRVRMADLPPMAGIWSAPREFGQTCPTTSPRNA